MKLKFFSKFLFLFSCFAFSFHVNANPCPIEIRYEFPIADANEFYVDFYNNGQPQKVAITKTGVFQNFNISVFNTSNKLIFSTPVSGQNYWSITHLREIGEPELIHYFVDGTGAFVNDFKIFGIKSDGSIGILFDWSNINYDDRISIGGGCVFSIDTYKGMKAVWESNNYKVKIYWDGGKFIATKEPYKRVSKRT